VLQAEIELVVPFFDVDSMDVVWHGHYVKYFEMARCALLDRLGHNYTQMRAAGYVWPIIDLQLRYIRGARFGQTLIVRADLIEWENRLKIHYLISDAETGERMTRGSSVQVAVAIASREMQLASPRVLLDAVEKALDLSAPQAGPGGRASSCCWPARCWPRPSTSSSSAPSWPNRPWCAARSSRKNTCAPCRSR
jgi:acyl-CoA thioester hydrolase